MVNSVIIRALVEFESNAFTDTILNTILCVDKAINTVSVTLGVHLSCETSFP